MLVIWKHIEAFMAILHTLKTLMAGLMPGCSRLFVTMLQFVNYKCRGKLNKAVRAGTSPITVACLA